MFRRVLTGLFGSLILTGALSQAEAAAPPTTPSLTGEQLTANGAIASTQHYRTRCNADGTGTMYWTSSGLAAVPYNGTYYEAGFATLGPAAANGARTWRIYAVYQINSVAPPARIRGSKQFGPYTLFLSCQDLSYGFFAIGMTYQATIEANGETYRDQGYSNITTTQDYLNEDFSSTQGPVLQPSGDGGDGGSGGGGDRSHSASFDAPVQAPSAGPVSG